VAGSGDIDKILAAFLGLCASPVIMNNQARLPLPRPCCCGCLSFHGCITCVLLPSTARAVHITEEPRSQQQICRVQKIKTEWDGLQRVLRHWWPGSRQQQLGALGSELQRLSKQLAGLRGSQPGMPVRARSATPRLLFVWAAQPRMPWAVSRRGSWARAVWLDAG